MTRIFSQIEHGDVQAAEQLLPLVYNELRKLATQKMAQEKPGLTLQPTALVHEAFMRLVNQTTPLQWDGRGHFFSAAAEAMRRILVEDARRKNRLKRGGDLRRQDLSELKLAAEASPEEILDIDEAIYELSHEHPEKAKLVKLRFFGGLSPRQQRLWAFPPQPLIGIEVMHVPGSIGNCSRNEPQMAPELLLRISMG